MPARADTPASTLTVTPSPSPTPSPTVTPTRQASQAGIKPGATAAPLTAPLSLNALRSLFIDDATVEPSRDVDNKQPAVTLPDLLSKTALHSPLAPPLPAVGKHSDTPNAGSLLPTPTPTPSLAQHVSLAQTAPVSPTAPITQMLDLALPDAATTPAPEPITDGTDIVAGDTEDAGNIEGTDDPEPNNADSAAQDVVAVATPAPQPPAASAIAAPTPDGASRTVRVPILMYHYLSAPPPDANIYRKDLSVSPELFAAHLDAMQGAGYTTVTLYELIAHLTQGAPLPEKPVIITFDDGYRDVYENALPLLRERDMVATFFVVTDFVDEERPEYVTWDMAREMQDAGMKIESHGRNHVSLQGKDHDYLVWQALGSMETIEYEMGSRPRFVSYPAGEYNQDVANLFASAGYWAGATTVQGATHSSDALFDLNRVRVRGTTTPEELLRLLALDW